MCKLLFYIVVLIAACSFTYAISTSDFVPNFLTAKPIVESSAEIPVRPLVNVKRNASTNQSWYCNRMQDSASNVFCKNAKINVESHVESYNHTKADRTAVVSNSVIVGDKLNQDMVNRTNSSFQDQRVTDYLSKQQNQIQDSAIIPIQTGENVKMNIKSQQIQFNIKY